MRREEIFIFIHTLMDQIIQNEKFTYNVALPLTKIGMFCTFVESFV